MATSVVPALIDALVTQMTTALPAVRVHDGIATFDVSGDPTDALIVGAEDLDPQFAGQIASSTRTQIAMGPAGAVYQESGTLKLLAHSWNGDAVQKRSRDAVYAICDAVDNLIRTTHVSGTTPSVLGVAGVNKAVVELVPPEQNVFASADTVLVFTVAFVAII